MPSKSKYELPTKGAENLYYRNRARKIAENHKFEFKYTETNLLKDGKRHWVLSDMTRKVKARLLDMRSVVLLTEAQFIEQHLQRDVKSK